MELIRAESWQEALEAKAADPHADALLGGTDVMVEINLDKGRPEALIDIGGVPELRTWSREGDVVRLGAGVPYTRIVDELGELLPGLAQASRTVGSPQIRNRGSVGGNLGAASPAGDAHPPLMAAGAQVEACSLARGTRTIAIDDFYVGPKRNALEDDELIAAVLIPVARGAQQFSKIGTRNAMVISVCSFAISLDPATRRVGTGIGSAGPTPLRARSAEAFLEQTLDEQGAWDGGRPLDDAALERFGELVAAAARPIDDVRSTADYRRHALGVMARRTAVWALRGEG
ncbi:MAG TPA: FAD binding domain-containing protein [Conexibacter sp.]|nr:FAD binding domain-containing protein [Conexibacter sp.]